MSMIRAQEYFAPLRSRHISLQQWERGLLFESWGSRGGRLDRQNSGDLNNFLSATDSEEQEFRRPVKKGIARSVSFSPSLGRELSSELKITKNLARGLSFPRTLASHEEITTEDYVFGTSRRILNADHSHIFTAQTSTAFLFPRSLESSMENGHIESSETSDISSSFRDSEDSSSVSDPPADLESRPWPRKFFSGGLSFSRDRNFFSGVLSFSKEKRFFSGSLSLPRRCAGPCGKGLDRSQSWGVNDNFSPDLKNAATASSSESRLKNRFLARVLTFSRSLDPRGEISKSPSKANKGTENHEKKSFTLRRGLSFSSSLDPNGENKYYGRGLSFSRSFSRSLDANSENKYFGRGLSFSRSFQDANGEQLSSEDCSNSGSPKSEVPELTWSKRFISRSGLFFSKTLSPKRSRESPSDTCSEKDSTEARPKKRIGHRFSLSFSRFLEPFGDSSSVNSGGTNGPGPKVESKESPFKRFFTRGFQFSNAKSVDTVDQASPAAACETTGPSGNGAKPQSKRFFSKEWSWSRTKSRSTSPAKNSSQTLADSTNSPGTDGIQVCESDNPSSRHSQALKNWWSKRCQNSGMSSRSAHANDQNSRLVLLEKVPESDDKESDGLTVYVGERGGSLTKYVLAKKILRHHLFQVLLKCSQDELGSDHDYTSGVPIICDPALFLQVARAVGGNFSSETQLCRMYGLEHKCSGLKAWILKIKHILDL